MFTKQDLMPFIAEKLVSVFQQALMRLQSAFQAQVNQLYSDIFAESFKKVKLMTRSQFKDVLQARIEDDSTLQQWLLDEYDKMVCKGSLDAQEVKMLIVQIFKRELFTEPEQADNYISAKISATIDKYQSDFQLGSSGNTISELQTILDDYFLDAQVNSELATVKGADMCELLGLFFDLAEAGHKVADSQIKELHKYRTAYQNKIKREKKASTQTADLLM